MNRFAFQLLGVVLLSTTSASIRIPFSGSLGATTGAGSMVGWETLGLGLNPAIEEPQIIGILMATYAPFGIENLRISEVGFSWAGDRWGTGVAYRGWENPMGYSSAIEIREALRVFRGFGAGVSLGGLNENGESKIMEMGTGFIWNRFSFLTLGAKSGIIPNPSHTTMSLGLGAEGGFEFRGGMAIRICVENYFQTGQVPEWRFGSKLRLHSMLSLYAGFNPSVETMGLGIQFGMGHWEGFHAMRIHSVLGSSSLQALRWKRHLEI